MKVIDLRPPPACFKSYRLKFSLFTKNSLFSQIKQKSIKLAIKLCIDYNEMNILQYVCPQYPHSYEILFMKFYLPKLAHRSSVLRPRELM